MYVNLAIVAAFVFFYSLSSGGLEKTLFSGAIVYTAFGFILGPLGLGVLNLSVGMEGLRLLAELSLALLLFSDAANANLLELKRSFRIPEKLLLIGLPLIILLGFSVGVLIFDGLSLLEIAIIATILAPTDAALGKQVVTNLAVPGNIREGLNVESGFNDGICVPILLIFLAIETSAGGNGEAGVLALALVTEAIGTGVAVGIGFTYISVQLLRLVAERGWLTETWQQLPVPALAVTCFATAQVLGGSGFIACFVGGMLFGILAEAHKHKLLLAAEGTGDTLALITWVVFGAAVVGRSIDVLSWQVIAYALLSLTVIRMLPVFLVLMGSNLRTDEKLFIGWFGPRGLASIVFGLIVIEESLPGGRTISVTVVCTILLSIILHGITANPLVALLSKRLESSNES
ncbi:MAG: cation:proton antiporter [Gammaproteobacteria bacterium]|nr:cation:proton antiporter [Gammaproteobacteria bacterium]